MCWKFDWQWFGSFWDMISLSQKSRVCYTLFKQACLFSKIWYITYKPSCLRQVLLYTKGWSLQTGCNDYVLCFCACVGTGSQSTWWCGCCPNSVSGGEASWHVDSWRGYRCLRAECHSGHSLRHGGGLGGCSQQSLQLVRTCHQLIPQLATEFHYCIISNERSSPKKCPMRRGWQFLTFIPGFSPVGEISSPCQSTTWHGYS